MSKFNATHKTPDGELLHNEGGKYYTRHAYENFGAAYVGEAVALGSAEEHSWEDDLRELGMQRSKLAGTANKAAKIAAVNQAMSQGQIYIPIPTSWSPASSAAPQPNSGPTQGLSGKALWSRDGHANCFQMAGLNWAAYFNNSGWTLRTGTKMTTLHHREIHKALASSGGVGATLGLIQHVTSALSVHYTEANYMVHRLLDNERDFFAAAQQSAAPTAQSQLGFDPIKLQAAAIALDLKQAGTNAHQSTWLVSHDMETVHDVEQQLQVYGVYLKGQGLPVAYDINDVNVDLVSRYYNSPIAPPQARVYILAVDGIAMSPYDRICQAGREVLSDVTDSPDQLRHVTITGMVS